MSPVCARTFVLRICIADCTVNKCAVLAATAGVSSCSALS